MRKSEQATRWLALTLGAGLAPCLIGCHTAPGPAGSTLPTTSPHSAALPGAVDAADAPNAPSVSESRQASLVTYRDPAHGVSFRYPSVWRPPQAGTGNAAYAVPDYAAVAPAPVITQTFLPAGTVYADTALQSLSFSYTVQQSSTAATCAEIPARAVQQNQRSTKAAYNGLTYSEASGRDGAACHERAATIDTVLRGSACYVFERDEMTICPGIRGNQQPRPLTAGEQASLQGQLDGVMASVQVGHEGP